MKHVRNILFMTVFFSLFFDSNLTYATIPKDFVMTKDGYKSFTHLKIRYVSRKTLVSIPFYALIIPIPILTAFPVDDCNSRSLGNLVEDCYEYLKIPHYKKSNRKGRLRSLNHTYDRFIDYFIDSTISKYNFAEKIVYANEAGLLNRRFEDKLLKKYGKNKVAVNKIKLLNLGVFDPYYFDPIEGFKNSCLLNYENSYNKLINKIVSNEHSIDSIKSFQNREITITDAIKRRSAQISKINSL